MSTMLVVLAAASKLDGRPWWKILMSGSSLTPGVPRYAVGATVRGTCGTCGTLEAGMRMAYVAALRLRYVRYAGGRYAYPVRTARPRHSMATQHGCGTVWLPMSTRARTKSAGDRDALGVVPAHLEPGELHLHQQVVLPQLVRRQRVVREQVCALVTRAAAWWDMWRWARRT